MSEPQGALKGIALGLVFSFLIVIAGLLALVMTVLTGDWLWLVLLVTDVLYLIGYVRKRWKSRRGRPATNG